MNISSMFPMFKNAGEPSSPSQYQPINTFSLIIKIFEAIINKKVVEYNSWAINSILFRSSSSTADIVTIIMHGISEALDNKNILRLIDLDISQGFENVWLQKSTCYRIYGIFFSVIKSCQVSIRKSSLMVSPPIYLRCMMAPPRLSPLSCPISILY